MRARPTVVLLTEHSDSPTGHARKQGFRQPLVTSAITREVAVAGVNEEETIVEIERSDWFHSDWIVFKSYKARSGHKEIQQASVYVSVHRGMFVRDG